MHFVFLETVILRKKSVKHRYLLEMTGCYEILAICYGGLLWILCAICVFCVKNSYRTEYTEKAQNEISASCNLGSVISSCGLEH